MSAPGETPAPAKADRRGLWLRLGGTILTLLLLVFLIQQQGWQEIGEAVKRVAPWRLWASLAIMLVSRTAVSLRWYALLRGAASGDKPVSMADSLRITYAGLFASNFLPTTIGGDVVRLAACLQLRYDAAVSTASLVVDRLVGMAGMALVLPWGLVRLAQVGLPALSAPESALPQMAGLAWSGRLHALRAKLFGFIRRILAYFQLWGKHPRGLAFALFFTLVHQACLYITIRLMLDGMALPSGGEEPLGWLRIAGIWSLVYFITLLPISINGYGLQEVSTTLLYAHLGGISTETAAAVALLQRVVQMAASLPGAFFAPGILAASRKSRQETQA
jgi:uncharacterized membrane protein YbhN (UPF0104 family)